jgi:hypothetical protein
MGWAMRRLLFLLLLVAVLWTGAWFYLTGELRDRFEASLEAARAQGWVIEAGAPARAGFPLAAAITVPDVIAAGGTALPVAGRLQTRRLVLAFALASPRTLSIGLPRGFEVVPAEGKPFDIRATTLVGAAPLAGPRSIEFDATGVAVTRAGVDDGSATRMQLRLEPRGADLGFLLALDDVRLPSGRWVLGPRLSSLVAAGDAGGALAVPPADGVHGVAGWLADWRDHGGKLTLERMALGWGPLGLAGSATLALDADLQPDADARLTVLGYDETIAAMAGAGLVAPGPALAARFGLGLLAKPGPEGARPRIDVAASLHGGKLTVGGVALGKLPKLSWPGAP